MPSKNPAATAKAWRQANKARVRQYDQERQTNKRYAAHRIKKRQRDRERMRAVRAAGKLRSNAPLPPETRDVKCNPYADWYAAYAEEVVGG